MDGLLFDTEALYQQSFLEVAKLGRYTISDEVVALAIGVPWVRSRN